MPKMTELPVYDGGTIGPDGEPLSRFASFAKRVMQGSAFAPAATAVAVDRQYRVRRAFAVLLVEFRDERGVWCYAAGPFVRTKAAVRVRDLARTHFWDGVHIGSGNP